MAEHWCKEHQQAWFKKGNMKGYAHPILNEDGEPTGDWCNEPKSEKPTKESQTNEGEIHKTRGVALRMATDIHVAMIGQGKETSAIKVINAAVLFESYIVNGAIVKETKSE